MILPIGHEGSGVRRLPWVTFAIILINVIVFLFTNGADKEIQKDLKDAAVKVVTYYLEHPYLKLELAGPDGPLAEYGLVPLPANEAEEVQNAVKNETTMGM